MNAQGTFTTSTRHATITLLVAALLALSALVTQNQLSSLTGIGSITVAHACQSHTGGC